ncbi:MAG: hypothetical protein AAB932_03950 [Patescibacteria group bacterium]
MPRKKVEKKIKEVPANPASCTSGTCGTMTNTHVTLAVLILVVAATVAFMTVFRVDPSSVASAAPAPTAPLQCSVARFEASQPCEKFQNSSITCSNGNRLSVPLCRSSAELAAQANSYCRTRRGVQTVTNGEPCATQHYAKADYTCTPPVNGRSTSGSITGSCLPAAQLLNQVMKDCRAVSCTPIPGTTPPPTTTSTPPVATTTPPVVLSPLSVAWVPTTTPNAIPELRAGYTQIAWISITNTSFATTTVKALNLNLLQNGIPVADYTYEYYRNYQTGEVRTTSTPREVSIYRTVFNSYNNTRSPVERLAMATFASGTPFQDTRWTSPDVADVDIVPLASVVVSVHLYLPTVYQGNTLTLGMDAVDILWTQNNGPLTSGAVGLPLLPTTIRALRNYSYPATP